jgi:hypothetical protein
MELSRKLEALNLKVVSEIDNGHTLVNLCSNGMTVVICTDDRVFNLTEIMQNHAAMKKLAAGEKKLVLTFAGKKTSINSEARKYLSLGLHSEFTQAEAFVLQSLGQRILALVYIKLRRPIVPTNYFSKAEKAMEWLKKQK